ncbi:MAG: spore coat U domain-containing protein [Steroidobacteraceae bacterium]
MVPAHLLRRHAVALTLALLSAVLPGVASAAASCTLSATGPAFGIYNPFNAVATLSNGSVTATCNWTGGGSTTVNLVTQYSAGASGNFGTRYMLSGANRLDYNIYFDAALTQIRGDGTGGSLTGSGTLTVSRFNRTDSTSSVIYGRIPAGQNAMPGTYADTIVVTVTY